MFQSKQSQVLADFSNVNTQTIWGNVLTYLREKHEMGLHISCSNGCTTEIVKSEFVVYVETDFALEMLSDATSLASIKSALSSSGWHGAFLVKKIVKEKTAQEKDIEKMISLAGNKFKRV